MYVGGGGKKNRMCADYSTGINDCLKIYNYPLPCPEEIFAKLNGGKIFSKLNLSDAYLQISLKEKCTNPCACVCVFTVNEFVLVQ